MIDINNKKTAIYIRVSTHWQVDKDSLQVQERELKAYNEMILGIPHFEIFRDAGYSAKNTDRPEFQQMMSRVRKGEFSHVLVWKIDRISRNLLDFTAMYTELKSLGVAFVSKNEQFDTSTAIGEAMLKIILVFAELERNMTAERVSAVMISRANNGQWNGGKVPRGYDWNKEEGIFTINEDAEMIKAIFEEYLLTRSLTVTSQHINDKGYRSRTGHLWSPATIRLILKNEFYIGNYVYNVHPGGGRKNVNDKKEWVVIKDHHIPIIDETTFNKVKNILYGQRTLSDKFFKTYQRKNIHIFAGLCKCGMCGSNMSATKDNVREHGYRPSVYGCALRRKTKTQCSNPFLSDVKLGPFMINIIANIMRMESSVSKSTSIQRMQDIILSGDIFQHVISVDPYGLSELKKVMLNKPDKVNFQPTLMTNLGKKNNERDLIEQQVRKEETALKRLTAIYLYGDSDMPEKDYIIERDRISDNIAKYTARLEQINKESNSDDTSFIEKASYFLMQKQLLGNEPIVFDKFMLTVDESILRSFMRSILKEIVITSGKVTSIKFHNNISLSFIYDK